MKVKGCTLANVYRLLWATMKKLWILTNHTVPEQCKDRADVIFNQVLLVRVSSLC